MLGLARLSFGLRSTAVGGALAGPQPAEAAETAAAVAAARPESAALAKSAVAARVADADAAEDFDARGQLLGDRARGAGGVQGLPRDGSVGS